MDWSEKERVALEMIAELRRMTDHFAGCRHVSGTHAAVIHERLMATIEKAEAAFRQSAA